MPTTWRRVTTGAPRATLADQRPAVDQILASEGQRALSAIKGSLWANSRFKRPTGRSNAAWKVERADWNGEAALIFACPAENRYGTQYAKFVHLAGRPKSERLIYEVERYLFGEHAERLAKRIGELRVQRGATTTTTIGG